jgi:hypothetical protein
MSLYRAPLWELLECCCLKFGVLFLWGTLSDERAGVQFADWSPMYEVGIQQPVRIEHARNPFHYSGVLENKIKIKFHIGVKHFK